MKSSWNVVEPTGEPRIRSPSVTSCIELSFVEYVAIAC